MTDRRCFERVVRRVSRPVAAVLLLTGCFQYVPAEVTPLPKPETEVRVTLTDPLDIPMGEFTLHDVTRIEGITAQAEGDTLGMVAKWLYPQVGRKYDALFGAYNIPLAGIQQLEEWRFSGRRTAIFLGTSAVLTGLFLHAAWRVIRGGRPEGEPPPPASVVGPR